MELWWCRSKGCGRISPVFFGENEEEIEERKKCWLEHKVSVLEPVEDSFVSERSDIEPVKTTFFYAVDENGKRWVVKQWREAIEEPRCYEIFEGRIATWITDIHVQEDAIRQRLTDLKIKEPYEDFLIIFLKNQIPFVKYDTEMVVEGNNSPEIQILLNRRMVVHLIAQTTLFLKKSNQCLLKKLWKRKTFREASCLFGAGEMLGLSNYSRLRLFDNRSHFFVQNLGLMIFSYCLFSLTGQRSGGRMKTACG